MLAIASSFSLKFTLLILMVAFATADPEITDDFLIPGNVNPNTVDGSFFTFTGLRGVLASPITKFTVTQVTKKEFPALDGQSVSLSPLQFPPGTVFPPRYHPRSAEAVCVLNGTLELGFVDPSTNKLINNTIQSGYTFVISRGIVHYLYNADKKSPASAVSAFGSANIGTASLPRTLSATGVDDQFLSKSFNTDVATIQKIKAGFKTKP